MPSDDRIEELFRRLRAKTPEPTTELEFKSPFTLLIAVVLSAQTTDVAVNKITRRLFAEHDTPEKLLALGEAGLEPHLRSIGLFRMKAKHVIALCRRLVEQFGGEVPRDREALQALPGVGRKTANVVLNTAFGEPTIAVDTHVFRVANRLGLSQAKTPAGVEEDLLRQVPAPYRQHAHHWLILHGRYVCQARKPRCGDCVLSDLCDYVRERGAPPPA